MEKANTLYEEAKMASLNSMENMLYYEDEYGGDGLLSAAPISRRGSRSRRSSRLSSSGHSPSGSMELNDGMSVGRRDVSLDLSDARGSSFSSEDSCAQSLIKPRAASLDTRLLDTPGPSNHLSSFPSSPRSER